MQAALTQAEMLYENWQIDKEKLNSQMKHNVLEKCGSAASDKELPKVLLLGQSEVEIEYDRVGRMIIKGQVNFEQQHA